MTSSNDHGFSIGPPHLADDRQNLQSPDSSGRPPIFDNTMVRYRTASERLKVNSRELKLLCPGDGGSIYTIQATISTLQA